MSASRFDFDLDEAVQVLTAAKGGGPEERRESLSYWIEATSKTNRAPPDVRVLAGEQMPVLAREFPDSLQEVYEAGCDLSEDDESEEVRIAGYRCMVMVAAQDSSFAGQVADVLLQLYRDTLEYKTSPTEEAALDGSLRSVLLSNPKSALQSFFYMIESGVPAQQKLLWDFLNSKAGKDLESLWRKERWDDVQLEYMQELFHAIPLAGQLCRPICLELLSRTPLCTGERAATNDREYYAQLVCEEALTHTEDQAGFAHCLELLSPAFHQPKETQPDPRWPLLLFNHNPYAVHVWARAPADTHHEDVGPSRLMDWTAWGYVKMRNELRNISLADGVPEYFGMRSLGADLCKASLMFMIDLLPEYRTVDGLSKIVQDVELYLLISYFLWLKFGDRLRDLMGEEEKQTLLLISRLADVGGNRETGQAARMWSNVATMGRNLAKTGHATKADKITVYPSWKPSTERSEAAANASLRAAGLTEGRGRTASSDPMPMDPVSIAAPMSDVSRMTTQSPAFPAEVLLPVIPAQAHAIPPARIPTGPRADRPQNRVQPSAQAAGVGRGMSIFKSSGMSFARSVPPVGPSAQTSDMDDVSTPSPVAFEMTPSEGPTLAQPPPSLAQSSSFSIHGRATRPSPVTEEFSIKGMGRANSPVTSLASNGSGTSTSPIAGTFNIFAAAKRENEVKRKRSHLFDGESGASLPSGTIAQASFAPAEVHEERPPKRGKLSLAERITVASGPAVPGPKAEPEDIIMEDVQAQVLVQAQVIQAQGGQPNVQPAPTKPSLLARLGGITTPMANGSKPAFRSPASDLKGNKPVIPNIIPTAPATTGSATLPKPARPKAGQRPKLKDRISGRPAGGPVEVAKNGLQPGAAGNRSGFAATLSFRPSLQRPAAQVVGAPSGPKELRNVRPGQREIPPHVALAGASAVYGGQPAFGMVGRPPTVAPKPPVDPRQVIVESAKANGIRVKGRGFGGQT